MIICPVCKKNLKSQFALEGHLRLKTDDEHKNYYRQKNLTKNEKIIALRSNNIISSTGVKTIDLLEDFIQKYKENHAEEIKEDRFIEKLKKMIQEEIKIDLDKERERIREEVMYKYQTDVTKAVDEEKEKLKERNKEEIESIRIKIKNEYKEEYHNKYAIYLRCIYCHDNVLLPPGSELHNILDVIATNHKLVYHPECNKLNNPI